MLVLLRNLRAIFGTANRKFVEQSPGQNVHLYSSEVSAKMAKNKNKKDKETGKRKPRKSKNGKQKQREKNSERMTIFNRRKEKEEALKDMNTRETALEKLGIKDRFEFADHAKIYNAEHGKFHSAPIHMIDASVPPAPLTYYPERSPSPAYRQLVPKDQPVPAEPTVFVAPLDVKSTKNAHARRSRAIYEAHFGK